jgi:hypothetical protein
MKVVNYAVQGLNVIDLVPIQNRIQERLRCIISDEARKELQEIDKAITNTFDGLIDNL